MTIILAVLCGFCLDLLFADPTWILHPVVIMGKCITVLERALRRIFPKTPKGEWMAGTILAIVLPLGTFGLTSGLLRLCAAISPLLAFAVETVWCWQAIAVKGLYHESMCVSKALAVDVSFARKAVARIVGRDTDALTPEGVIKATVETVAENYADGVVAPLLFLMLGGAPLGLAYKAVNTMDSMVGYRNERYLYFGRTAAKIDDAANFLPARLAALLLVAAAYFTRQNAAAAYHIWRRDRRHHASPNSAQTEAAMAGALGVELAGSAYYFGKLYEKQSIGDATRNIEIADILHANRMLLVASVLCLLLFCTVRVGFVSLGFIR